MEILEINTDITQQKAAEEGLRNLNQELEHRVIERTAELRQSNEQLHQSMDRYRFLADSMPQIVWTTKPDGAAEYFNRRWHEYTGLALEESQADGRLGRLNLDNLRRQLENSRDYVFTQAQAHPLFPGQFDGRTGPFGNQ